MSDVDRILEQLLGDRRMSESATFSTRSYSDQPILEKGSDLKARMERRAQERATRHEREARERASERTHRREAARAPKEQSRGTISGFDALLQSIFDQGLTAHVKKRATLGAKTATALEIPESIREMRKLEGAGVPRTLAYGSSSAAGLFYRQAVLMESYEDDYEYHGNFSQYYPTYTAMSDRELRGYFSWRTKVRQGQVEATSFSFAFVYVYELLMGIGTTPGEQGLADLQAFGHAYQQADELLGIRLYTYLRRWLHDYALYHDLPLAREHPSSDAPEMAVLTLLAAEHAQLRASGTEPRIPNQAVEGMTPTPEQIFAALSTVSTHHIGNSRLTKSEPELTTAVACDVFAALVAHCAKRRKTDFVEGLFGYGSRAPYTMFSAAVFYDPVPHPDCRIQASPVESFECKDGRWWRTRACQASQSNAVLGQAMHAVDYELRQQLDYPYPLKPRDTPKYLRKMVTDAIAARLEERAEAERRRISIDLSQLDAIRAAAAVTQDALLTDEEREDSDRIPEGSPLEHVAHEMAPTHEASEGAPQGAITQTTATTTVAPSAEGPAQNNLLSAEEAQLLAGLLNGAPAAELASTGAQFMSVIVDSINEKLFDLIGDAVIEFDGDDPCLVEDYLEDIREVLYP